MHQTYIALLKGINVGGHHILKMEALRQYCEELGWKNIKTYIQSGNIVFQTQESNPNILSQQLEEKLAKHFDFPVPSLVLSVVELVEVFNHNPYIKMGDIDIDKLYVSILSALPDEESVEQIDGGMFSPDEFTIIGRAIYLHVKDRISESKYSNTFFEKRFNTQVTTRNWKTITKLFELTNLP